MRVFVDTSALYALLAIDDLHHEAARRCFEQLDREGAVFVSTNYILLECASLIQRRRGFEPASTFLTRAAERLQVLWIGEPEHREAVALWARAQRRALSLVDCSSIAVMRQQRLEQVVAFDRQFTEAGFDVLPSADRVAERRGVYRAGRGRRLRRR